MWLLSVDGKMSQEDIEKMLAAANAPAQEPAPEPAPAALLQSLLDLLGQVVVVCLSHLQDGGQEGPGGPAFHPQP